MLERRQRDAIVYYVSPLLQEAGAPHAFSTRLGGVSSVPFDSMNLGTLGSGESSVQDSIDNIRANQRLLRRSIGCESREACNVHQVHGADVLAAHPGEPFENGRKADAIISDDPARVLSVKYADCVPILLASPDGRTVAAIHAGWRGVIAGAVPAAVKQFPSNDLLAAIGPSIGFDAFEVGLEVLDAFTKRFGPDAPIRRLSPSPLYSGERAGVRGSSCLSSDSGKGYIDLRQAVRLQLLEAGLQPDRIDTTDRCTFRDANEFFSHRRDQGITGRMAAFIGARQA